MALRILAADYGDPEAVLQIVDQPVPEPDDGDVVVRVRSAGVNPFDAKQVRGLVGADPAKLPLSIGGEAAGVVHAAGASSGFRPGEEVVVYPATGAFAEFLVAPAAHVHRKPADLGFNEASALLLAGVTAADILATLELTADDVLLVHGGAGAVGSIVVSRAVTAGATVIATASPANHVHLRSLGAVPVAYDGDLLAAVRTAMPSPVTAVADTVGTDQAIDVSLALVPADRIVSIAAWGLTGEGITMVDGSTPASRRNRREAIAGLLDDAAAGRLAVEIGGTFPLQDTAAALSALGGHRPRGKLIIHP
ncbi:putative oxidoreductase [Gordonia hirsuta DSM 44140 = NBRC 16056]|uniref:Putative oxidoreductase n=1 Tax=Gordonia hirsuta DSM 44140 = NBRC 16056 TaxID=1121927 RepID=L7LBE1_9ACTN|nr:NADP-dependent oxidoreductase [Gordonia hirsuta]GAC58450.1 putative oxidoreductase [Gordonia hirsuta DSM 44140 = NBRC 16056]